MRWPISYTRWICKFPFQGFIIGGKWDKVRTLPIIIMLVCLLPSVSPQLGNAESLHCGDSDALCGPQSLFVVCQSLGIEADIQELANLSGFNEKTGTTMLGLQTAAKAKGLHAVGTKIGIDDLARLQIQAIAHLWSDHFVVVESSNSPNELKMTDPPRKPQLISLEDFGKTYSGFSLLISKDKNLFPKAKTRGPDIRFDSYDFDFGFIEEGRHVGRAFIYENKGNEELVISKAETSCTCTQAFLSEKQRISPDGTGELVVGFDSTGRRGGQSHTVYVYSNDPISPIVQLKIVGVIKPDRVITSVRSLHFGMVKKRDGATREFLIRDPGDNSLVVNEVICDSPFVDMSFTQNTDKQGSAYMVTAVLQSGVPVGEMKAKIIIRTNHPKEPMVEIPVLANVIGDIEAFPSQFFLGLLKKGQSVSKTISLSTTSKEPLMIQDVDSPFDYLAVKLQPETQDKKYNITATLKESAPLGLIKGEVVVHTNNLDQPEIKVPVYAYITN